MIFKHSNDKSRPTVSEVRMCKVHLAVDPKGAIMIYAPKCKPKLQMEFQMPRSQSSGSQFKRFCFHVNFSEEQHIYQNYLNDPYDMHAKCSGQAFVLKEDTNDILQNTQFYRQNSSFIFFENIIPFLWYLYSKQLIRTNKY